MKKIILAIVTLTALLCNFAYSAERTFISASGDWDNPSNWSGGILPNDDDDVVIPSLNHCFLKDDYTPKLNSIRLDGKLTIAPSTPGLYIVDVYCRDFIRGVDGELGMSDTYWHVIEDEFSSEAVFKIYGDNAVSFETLIIEQEVIALIYTNPGVEFKTRETTLLKYSSLNIESVFLSVSKKFTGKNLIGNEDTHLKIGAETFERSTISDITLGHLEISSSTGLSIDGTVHILKRLQTVSGAKIKNEDKIIIGPDCIIDGLSSQSFIATDPGKPVIKQFPGLRKCCDEFKFFIGPDESTFNPVSVIEGGNEISAWVRQKSYRPVPNFPPIGVNDEWNISGTGNANLKFEWNQSDAGVLFRAPGPIFLVFKDTVIRGILSDNSATFFQVPLTNTETPFRVGKIAIVKEDGFLQYSTPDMSSYDVRYEWKLQNFDGADASLQNTTTNVVNVNPSTTGGISVLWLTVIYANLADGADDFVISYGIDWNLTSAHESTSITSQVNLSDVNLSWTTGSESKNSGFKIEKRSFKNDTPEEWSEVGFINGNESNGEQKDYVFADKNLRPGKYQYRLKQIDLNGNSKYIGISEDVFISSPESFYLFQNYPNPFNPVTSIDFNIVTPGKVKLIVFDNKGSEVKSILNEFREAGYYSEVFDASDLTSGVYYYRIETGKYVETKKMVLIK